MGRWVEYGEEGHGKRDEEEREPERILGLRKCSNLVHQPQVLNSRMVGVCRESEQAAEEGRRLSGLISTNRVLRGFSSLQAAKRAVEDRRAGEANTRKLEKYFKKVEGGDKGRQTRRGGGLIGMELKTSKQRGGEEEQRDEMREEGRRGGKTKRREEEERTSQLSLPTPLPIFRLPPSRSIASSPVIFARCRIFPSPNPQVQETSQEVEAHLWRIVRDFLSLGRTNPTLLVSVVRIIEMQETMDAQPASKLEGTRKGYRDKAISQVSIKGRGEW